MSTLALHHGSVGLVPESLRAGRDLVIDPAWAHGLALASGTVLDDYLEGAARAAIESDARAALERWRERTGTVLTVDGVDLAHIAEVELLKRCFVPTARLMRALPAAMRTLGTAAVTGASSAGLLRVALAIAAEHGAEVSTGTDGAAGLPQPFIWRGFNHMAVAATAGTRWLGVRPRVRGAVVCLPYWQLLPLYRRLARAGGRVQPVAAGVALPSLGPHDALGVALRGGWLGVAGARARRRSRAAVDAAVGRAAAAAPAERIESAVFALALEIVRTVTADAPAEAKLARGGLANGRARLLVLPWDSPAVARVLLAAARDAGVPSLLVQHGFDPDPSDPDKLLAEHIAAWSAAEAEDLVRKGRSRGEITVTGNPGASHLTADVPRNPGRGRTLVLPEYPLHLSARIDARISARQVATALRGLAAARPGTAVVIRPHPSDPVPQAYGSLAASLDLRVSVDPDTPIEALLRTADLVVGSISTVTLQAAALGVPVVFLELTGLTRPHPFDGAPNGLPRVTTTDELATVVRELIGAPGVRGQEAVREALGARSDAVERCVALVDELAR